MDPENKKRGLNPFEAKFGAAALGIGVVNLSWGAYWIIDGSVTLDNWGVYTTVSEFIRIDILGLLFFIGAVLFLLSIGFIPTARLSRKHNAFLTLGASISSLAYIILAVATIHHGLLWLTWVQAIGLMSANALLAIQGGRAWLK